jgi:hypothetical protein
LFTTSSAGAGSSLILFFLLEVEAASDVETELNHTPMDLNRDLTEAALLPRPPPPSESGRDHAGLQANLPCSGVRHPEEEEEDDTLIPRRSRSAMLG